MKVGNVYVSYCDDAAFEYYRQSGDKEIWEKESACAVLYCIVYADDQYTEEIDYFVIHQDEIKGFLGLGENDSIKDIDTYDVIEEMAKKGFLQENYLYNYHLEEHEREDI